MEKVVRLWIFLTLLALTFIYCAVSFAGDYNRGQQHKIVYTVTTASGDPVAGETVRVGVNRARDNSFLDWSDNTFKASGWTTRLQTMTYNPTGEFYETYISLDSAVLISNDYTVTVSNDSVLYGDYQAQTISYSSTEDLIRIHR